MFSRKLFLIPVVLVTVWLSIMAAQPPEITIVYPKPDQTIIALDSTFILGHIPASLLSRAREIGLIVNGQQVPLHPDGGFLAFVPIRSGDFLFQVEAFTKGALAGTKRPSGTPLAIGSVVVKVAKPLAAVPDDSLRIEGDYQPPRGDLVLASGQTLAVRFLGTPGGTGWFSIDGVADSVPMSEMTPQTQPYWGEALFGAGAVPDSLKVRGIYTGFLDVPCGMATTGKKVLYHLVKRSIAAEPTTRESGYVVSLNDPEYPRAVRFVDSITTIRVSPSQGYWSIFQPKGLVTLAVGAEGDWYRLQLSPRQYGWVEKKSVELLGRGVLSPKSSLKSIRTYGYRDSVLVEFPLSAVHPYRIIEDDQRTLRIQLFNVISSTDWIRYDFSDSLVRLATWSQPEEGLYEFRLSLSADVWGYDCYYKGNTFYLKLKKPPFDLHTLRGKRIVLDPGHSKEPGSTGPTGYTEAEANLALAKATRDALEARGATVIMTRPDDRNLPLADRPVIAKANRADLFVSIHNNALPDGVNPYANNGVSTYYYHPHSIALAKAVQTEMIKETGLADYGLFHGNLAVNRPTQYPAILVECAFIILPEQEALLKSDKFRRSVARAITDGIESFLKGYDHGR
jgi:N-acetylmuramoyl-L-alanine amidase